MTATLIEPGFIIGPHYAVESLLGRGGLGTVYLCRDLRNKASVAVKVARTTISRKEEDTLRREFSLLSRLKHPNLAQVFDLGRLDDNQEYIVEEYCSGKNLFDASADWSVRQTLMAFADLCRAVQFLHDRGVVHRDLKPGNILYRGLPDCDGVLKILDFGLAQFFASKDVKVHGTLSYMAPEVLSGHRPGPRSDIYALGVLLYQLLSRRVPFEDTDPGYLIQKHLQGEVDLRPVERLPSGPALGRVVAALLVKNPEQRPVSAEEIVRLLDGATEYGLTGSGKQTGDLYFRPAALVGRDNEIRLLRERARQVFESGRGWTVFVTGEAGSGKTRLMEELRVWGLLEGYRVVQGRCAPNERRLYGPYREILDSGGVESSRAGLTHPQHKTQNASNQLLGEPAALQFRDWLAKELLARLSNRPTIVLLHDFEWADETATVILDYLASDILAHPVLLCVSVLHPEAEQRPIGHLTAQISRQLRGEMLQLGPLTPDATVQLIAAMIGGEEPAQKIGEWIDTTFGGNPLCVEHTLKHLVDCSLLKREKGQWRLETHDLNHLRPPAGVAAIFRQRLSCLSAAATDLALWMAVINRPASTSFLAGVTPAGTAEIESTLEELIRRQIVRASDGGEERTYSLANASMADVILQGVESARKQSMHRKIGAKLRDRERPEAASEIAMHLIFGEAGAEALEYALQAEAESKIDSANDLTLFFAEYILEKGASLSTERSCEITADAAEACCALGQPDRAVSIVERWLDAGKQVSGMPRARLLMQLGICYQHLGDLVLLDKTCRQCLEVLGDDHSELADATRAIALRTLAYADTVRYRHREAVLFLDEALEALKRHDLTTTPFGGRIHIMLSVAHWTDCNYRASLASARKAVEILTRSQHHALTSQAYSIMAVALVSLGKLGLAAKTGELALDSAVKSRSVIARIVALGGLVESLCRSGRVQEALARADQATEILCQVKNPVLLYEVNAAVAEARLLSGDFSGAAKLLDELIADARPDLPVHSRAQVVYLRAWLDRQLGNLDAALRNVELLKQLYQQTGPVFEYELGEALRASIIHSQGYKREATSILRLLDARMRLVGRPYQTCVINLEIAELLLQDGDLGHASIPIGAASRLAAAMPSRHLAARAHLLAGRLFRILAEQKRGAGECRELLMSADENIGSGLSLADSVGVSDLIWPLRLEAARIAERAGQPRHAAEQFRQAMEHLERAHELFPKAGGLEFPAALERENMRRKCEEQLSRLQSSEAQQGRRVLVAPNDPHILLQMARVMTNIQDRDALLESLVDLLVTTLGMERVLVFLKDEGSDRLRLSKGRNVQKETVKRAEAISRTILNDVYRQAQPFVTANARSDPRVSTLESVQAFEIGTLFCGPLRVGDRTLGVVYADHPSPLADIGQSTIDVFAACCQLSAAALDSGGFGRGRPAAQRKGGEKPKDDTAEMYGEFLGKSAAIQELREKIRTVAASPLDVLIFGESGTGKELVARALHRTSARSKGRFLAVDCGSLTDSLVESEFFGYRKGAFTGAAEDRTGLLESAHGGTLFLDEVTNLSFQLQAKLLRVLQEREVRRVGDPIPRKVDLRVFAATNCDLEQEVREGRFRRDLYYRLNGIEIRVPALRDRQEDIPILVGRFLAESAEKASGPSKSFAPRAMELLKRYSYPGNVRELINAVGRGYYTSSGEVIDLEHLPREIHRSMGEGLGVPQDNRPRNLYRAIRIDGGNFDDLVRKPFIDRKLSREVVREVLSQALTEAKGRYREALDLLGVPGSEYHPTMAFLKRHDCLIDFRPFRKAHP
jgi:transcriptional regulator with GAF, ATPase, and Fis domain